MGTGASVPDRQRPYFSTIENGITVYHVEEEKEKVDKLLRTQKAREESRTAPPIIKGNDGQRSRARSSSVTDIQFVDECESTVLKASCRCWKRDSCVNTLRSISPIIGDKTSDESIVSAFLRLGNIWNREQIANETSTDNSQQPRALKYEEMFSVQKRGDVLCLPGTRAEWISSINRWVADVALKLVTSDPRFVLPLRALIGNENWACAGSVSLSGKSVPAWQYIQSMALEGHKRATSQTSVSLLKLIITAHSPREAIDACHPYARSCIWNSAEWKALLPCLLPNEHRNAPFQFGSIRLTSREVCMATVPHWGSKEKSLAMLLHAPVRRTIGAVSL